MAKTKISHPIDRHVGSRLRMRRVMLGMSQQQLGEAFGFKFQQVQKYEKSTNRMGASRLLQEAARILEVLVPYFFEGADGESYRPDGSTPSHAYINEFTASSEGLRLVKAFTRIARPAVRQHIVMLVQEMRTISPGDQSCLLCYL